MDTKECLEQNEKLQKELKAALFRERQYSSLLNEYKIAVDSSNIVSKTDVKGVITYVNKAFCETSGYDEGELLGRPQNIVRHPNMPKAVFKEMWETISNKRIYKGVIENKRKNGESYFVDATIVPILDLNGNIIEFLAIRHEITEFIRNKQKLFTNSLTGLPNRYKLSEDLAATSNGSFALLNIDSFKIINDYYGSKVGDFLLVELAKRFLAIFEPLGYLVYKLSSDEYGVLSPIFDDLFEQKTLEGARAACKEIIKCGDIEAYIGITIGIAFGRESLLQKAGMALWSAKTHRKQLVVYSEDMLIGKNYEQNLLISKALREAIENDWITPFYQPIADVKSGEIKKYEALVRIVKPNSQILSPFAFLDVAKATRLYHHITKTVVLKTFETFKERKNSFSINLSQQDILDENIGSFILSTLDKYALGERVVFEILESEGIGNYEEVSAFLSKLKARGARVAIDDFGSGYSNFEHMAKLNVDIIKIDGSLIKNINSSENTKVIVETIAGFAKRLGIKCVAEFVSSKEIFETIKDIGIDFAQGYYIGEPKPLADEI